MNPEDVPAELVEKAARARTAAQHGRPLDDAVWSAIRSRLEEAWIASALAAVLPEVQARVLTEVADKLESVPDCTGTSYDQGRVDQRHMDALVLHEEAARLRAARLTDTSEGEEK